MVSRVCQVVTATASSGSGDVTCPVCHIMYNSAENLERHQLKDQHFAVKTEPPEETAVSPADQQPPPAPATPKQLSQKQAVHTDQSQPSAQAQKQPPATNQDEGADDLKVSVVLICLFCLMVWELR